MNSVYVTALYVRYESSTAYIFHLNSVYL